MEVQNGLIYARYSSQGQNEQSIDGQLRINNEYAVSRHIKVVGTYIDKAKTGTNDNRPDFQRMIEDIKSGAYKGLKYVIVYMFDRFARNRLDSIMYKEILKRYGVKVISALEPVSEDEGGEFYEMYLEWNAEKYSKRLSKRVRDGLDTSVANGTFCGGHLVYGYKIHKEPIPGKNDRYIKYVAIDEETAPVVRFMFEQYADNVSLHAIAAALNAKGKCFNGKPFTGRTFEKWIRNEKYTGVFSFGGRVCDNMYPAIIDRATFDKVQKIQEKNKYFSKPSVKREKYLLTGKLYCGHCGTQMVANSGVSRTGVTYKYYLCKTARKGDCVKLREDKDILEYEVVRLTVEYLNDRRRLSRIADDVIDHHAKRTDTAVLKSLAANIANAEKEAEDTTTAYIKAVSTGNVILEKGCEKRIAELSALIENLKEQQIRIEIERGDVPTHDKIFAFVSDLINGDINDKTFQEQVINKLINCVYVSDDRTTIYFNFDYNEKPFISIKDNDEVTAQSIKKSEALDASSNTSDAGGAHSYPDEHCSVCCRNGWTYLEIAV